MGIVRGGYMIIRGEFKTMIEISAIEKEQAPRELLLLAYPDEGKITGYSEDAVYFAARERDVIVGVMVMEAVSGKGARLSIWR